MTRTPQDDTREADASRPPIHPFLGTGTSFGFGRAMRQTGKMYNRILQDRLLTLDLKLAEFLHLRELWIKDGLPQTDLARMIGIEKSSSTNVLLSLESKGLIERIRSEEDRRVINVSLTEAGKRLRTTVVTVTDEVALKAIEGIDAEDMRRLVSNLYTIYGNLSRLA